MSYQPIENYGIIGDLNTVALISIDGSIDYMCFPDFDSPTIFAALLDDEKGGSFQIHPVLEQMKCKQLYLPDTNVLLTRFLSSEGVGEITDFMPVQEIFSGNELVRRVTSIRGELRFRMKCMPRFNYARSSHKAKALSDYEILFESQGEDKTVLKLKSNIPIFLEEHDAYTEFTLKPGENVDFYLVKIEKDESENIDLDAFITECLYKTVRYWKDWVAQSSYQGRWLEIVNRSALVLKLLTSYRYGSVIAAPSFSLPEAVGGKRNWDYRYTWVRDACFTIDALLRLGYKPEARNFMNWVEKQCQDIKGQARLGIMYSLDGKRKIDEEELKNLKGYKNSRPVRIGNNAYKQVQLDIYGELMESAYLYNKYGTAISYDFWNDLTKQLDWLAGNWDIPDESIWEVRGGTKKFLYSRLLSWVAFDRAMKIAKDRSFPLNDKWRTERDKIFRSIYNDYWNEELQCFEQYPGAGAVDASSLMMPLLHFIGPEDPRWLSTLKKIEEDLVSDSVVYRYRNGAGMSDGFISHEGTFSVCTFWYVECLARSGQTEKARFVFEKMLGYANHLGLYSEQLGFQGEHLGNFPQALTHLGLIRAAYYLNKALNEDKN